MRRGPIVVLCPHFAPDTAPTGEVMTGIVEEFVRAGRRVHVVTALPWYRRHSVEPGWGSRPVRREMTEWGSIIRVHPFSGGDKRNLVRRALGFAVFSAVVGVCGLFAGGLRRPAAVVSMSPPLTLGLTGWVVARLRLTRVIFNIQDVFPDAAVATGALTNRRVIAVAALLERVTYRLCDRVVVLSEDLRGNVAAKIGRNGARKVSVIPNFVDPSSVVPMDRMTAYRGELGIGDAPVVMYAGNVGFSQSLEIVVEAARRIPRAVFVINGDGSARAGLVAAAGDVENLRFAGYQPRERVGEVLASGDIHLVPLRAGLGAVSVPSKTYAVMAAGRPVIAAIDPGTEVTRILSAAGAGVCVPPDDADALAGAILSLLDDPARAREMGENARRWVLAEVSPSAVAAAYLDIIDGAEGDPRR